MIISRLTRQQRRHQRVLVSFFHLLLAILLPTSFPYFPATISAEDQPLEPSLRVGPQDLINAAKSFRTRHGFHLQLVAAEPLVRDPVAVDFDSQGRMYVIELPEYNQYESRQPSVKSGCVKLLEDLDNDGYFDRATVFMDELNYPTAIACYENGVFIGAAPDILFCQDTDGDRRADTREIIFTGFGKDNAGERHLNSMRWGLDNRFYLSTSGGGGNVTAVQAENKTPVSVNGRCFVFDPRDLTSFELTSGGGQHGMCLDDWGRRYVCSNGVPMDLLIFDDRYLQRNPYLAAPSPMVGIAPDGKHTKLFRISPPEPWRVARTRLRAASDKGDYEGGQPFGFFTAATGVTVYRGDAWPKDFRGDILVGEPANNLVYRARPQADGLSLAAQRADDGSEFVASTDIWFRPVQFANTPDGTLFVLDMYRELIEGAQFLPTEILQHLDAVSGADRGRIYRIAPDDFRPRTISDLANHTSTELVTLLEHPNGWHRDTAARLLYQRQDRTVIENLEQLADRSTLAQGRLQAMYTLHGLHALTADVVLLRLSDAHPQVRRHAIQLAEPLALTSPIVASKLATMIDDPEAIVRYQLAFSLGELSVPGKTPVLTELARRYPGVEWMEFAIRSSLHVGTGAVLANLAGDKAYSASDGGLPFLNSLATQIGQQQRADDLAVVFHLIKDLPESASQELTTIITGLAAKEGSTLAAQLSASTAGRVDEVTHKLLEDALVTIRDAAQSIDQRVAAVQLLALGSAEHFSEVLSSLLGPEQPPAIQSAAIATLGTWQENTTPRLLIEHWPTLSPSLRQQTSEILFSRPHWIPFVLDAIESNTISPSDLQPSRLQQLANHPNVDIRTRAATLQENLSLSDRRQVLQSYDAALNLEANGTRGKAIFKKHCAACHQLEGIGHDLGPSLLTVRNRAAQTILLHILAPNREVDPKYLNYFVYTKEGRTFTGIVAVETATSITLKRASQESNIILRKDIDALQSTGLSLMPEGFEKQIDQQGMADLIEYVSRVTN